MGSGRRGLRYWWPALALGAVLLLYSAFAGVAWWLQANAYEAGARAMQDYPGDEVEALLGLVQSADRSLAERNRAVYALGQIGDPRALPILQRLHTGRECQHSKFLCQYELQKAIDRCSGRNWTPSWLPWLPRQPQDRPR